MSMALLRPPHLKTIFNYQGVTLSMHCAFRTRVRCCSLRPLLPMLCPLRAMRDADSCPVSRYPGGFWNALTSGVRQGGERQLCAGAMPSFRFAQSSFCFFFSRAVAALAMVRAGAYEARQFLWALKHARSQEPRLAQVNVHDW
jgi:hypothetical protein